jgi:hypothetical protein
MGLTRPVGFINHLTYVIKILILFRYYFKTNTELIVR